MMYERNQNGINVKRCCASCRSRRVSWEGGRSCAVTGMPVESGSSCDKWAMEPKLQNAGLSGGRVKTLRYLTFYRMRRTEQREQILAGTLSANDVQSAADIRREFNELHGSEFINI